jgi:glucose-1-phosphate thymidylyltransferase
MREIIGLIPAGGRATRIAPLPCSKELFPIGLQPTGDGAGVRPKVVSHYLLEQMRGAGARRAFIVIRKGKWDIPEYFGDGEQLGMSLGYLIMNRPYGAPYTIDQAHAFTQGAQVLFGFPDILLQPEDAYRHLLARQEATGADIALGLFPTDQPHTADVVETHQDGRLRAIAIKPDVTGRRSTWAIATWGPQFTEFLHAYLARRQGAADQQAELYMGHVIMAAAESGLSVQTAEIPGGSYLDIGIPENLVRALGASFGSIGGPEAR